MGKAMVSTRIGVEGLPVRDGDHLIIADEPDEFAAAVTKLLEDVQAKKPNRKKCTTLCRDAL